jgi:hypothetical protein
MYLANYEHWPDPITLGISAAGVVAGGQVYGGYAAKAEEKSQAAIDKYNAAVMEQEAKAIEAKTGFEQTRQAEAGARKMGTMRTEIGASGAVATIGTPLLAQAKQASELELGNLMIGYEGMTEAAQARSKATEYRMQAKLAKQRGRAAVIGGFVGGAGAGVSTGISAYGAFK